MEWVGRNAECNDRRNGMNTTILTREQINTDQWDTFILQSPQGSVYATTAWLDLVAPGWSAIVVDGHQGWQAVFPLTIVKKAYGNILVPPPFCQHLGPVLRAEENVREVTRNEVQCEIMRKIAATVPESLSFVQAGCAPGTGALIPWHWAGYRLSIRYTYRLSLLPDTDMLMDGLHSKKRNSIRKGMQHPGSVVDGLSIVALRESFTHAHYLSAGQKELLIQLSDAMVPNRKMFQLTAYSDSGSPAGTILVALWKNTAYLVYQQWISSEQRGIMDYLIWEGIILARSLGATTFDFEGSMLESVEKFFREFGGAATAYAVVERDRRPVWYHLANKLRSR